MTKVIVDATKHACRQNESHFVMCSPLLAGKLGKDRAACTTNIPPFWALLQCPGPSATHNMELDVMVASDLGFANKTGTPCLRAPKTVTFSAQIPIACNVTNIAKGDVLTLPWTATPDQ